MLLIDCAVVKRKDCIYISVSIYLSDLMIEKVQFSLTLKIVGYGLDTKLPHVLPNTSISATKQTPSETSCSCVREKRSTEWVKHAMACKRKKFSTFLSTVHWPKQIIWPNQIVEQKNILLPPKKRGSLNHTIWQIAYVHIQNY